MVQYYGLSDSNINNRRAILTSKFWSLLCYFLGIKRRLSTAFYPKTDGQTKWHNSTIKPYFCVFMNWQQNDWAWLLLIVEFVYNNFKNASTGHTLFELNCGYHLQILFEEKVNPRSQPMFADNLLAELIELMIGCWENLHNTQELQKQANNKRVKL